MKRMITGLLALCLLVLPVWAEDPPEETQQAYIQISSPEELLAMADHPEGNYVLMKDLDMTGVDWPCPDFSGKFDGNGHSILNLTIKAPGESQGQVLDGSRLCRLLRQADQRGGAGTEPGESALAGPDGGALHGRWNGGIQYG